MATVNYMRGKDDKIIEGDKYVDDNMADNKDKNQGPL